MASTAASIPGGLARAMGMASLSFRRKGLEGCMRVCVRKPEGCCHVASTRTSRLNAGFKSTRKCNMHCSKGLLRLHVGL